MGYNKQGRMYWCPACDRQFRKEADKGRVVCPFEDCGNKKCFRSAIGGGMHSRTLYRLRQKEKKKKAI